MAIKSPSLFYYIRYDKFLFIMVMSNRIRYRPKIKNVFACRGAHNATAVGRCYWRQPSDNKCYRKWQVRAVDGIGTENGADF